MKVVTSHNRVILKSFCIQYTVMYEYMFTTVLFVSGSDFYFLRIRIEKCFNRCFLNFKIKTYSRYLFLFGFVMKLNRNFISFLSDSTFLV